MKVRNFTPHTVNILGLSIEPEGLARVSSESVRVGSIRSQEVDIPLVRSVLGDVTGLPDDDGKSLFVVSRMVAAALPEREDLAVPADLVRDDKGRVQGCNALELV